MNLRTKRGRIISHFGPRNEFERCGSLSHIARMMRDEQAPAPGPGRMRTARTLPAQRDSWKLQELVHAIADRGTLPHLDLVETRQFKGPSMPA